MRWKSALALSLVAVLVCAPTCAKRVRAADDTATMISLLEILLNDRTGEPNSARDCLQIIAGKLESRELSADQLKIIEPRLDALLKPALLDAGHPLHADAVLLAAHWQNPTASTAARRMLVDTAATADLRLRAAQALLSAGDPAVLPLLKKTLADSKDNSVELRGKLIASLGKCDQAQIAPILLNSYATLEADLQPRAIEVLTQRPAWSQQLLAAIDADKIPTSALGVNQIRKLIETKDAASLDIIKRHWGTVRKDRNPQREVVIAQVRQLLKTTPVGNPKSGRLVFNRLCGQCHKIYGEGQDVGPEITANGRASYEQLLSNVLDPSLVIGAAFQAVDIQTTDGRVLTGLLTEDSPQRLVLRLAGGKVETIVRDDIEESHVSKLSLMPEGVEKQLKSAELVDLFSFLILDRPPEEAAAKLLPGASEVGSEAKK